METLLYSGGGHSFPPFELNESLKTYSPLFYTPTLLIIFNAVIGTIRYLTTKNIPWQDISSPLAPRQNRLTALSKLIIFLACSVTFSFLLDTIVVLARVFLEQGALSVLYIYYIGVSWFAWAIGILFLLDESHKFLKWYWIQYFFFALAALGETCVGWVWIVGVYKPRPGKASLFLLKEICLLIQLRHYLFHL